MALRKQMAVAALDEHAPTRRQIVLHAGTRREHEVGLVRSFGRDKIAGNVSEREIGGARMRDSRTIININKSMSAA